MRDLWVKMEEYALKAVLAGGAQIVDADKAAYAKLVQPVYDQFVKDTKLKALVERIRAA
jgi:TRAP-type C4-dicarboxylate transport system substrate-binding protein